MSDTVIIEYNSNRYIQSKNIRVFPCAHRGYYLQTTTAGGESVSVAHVFDPESRATTEDNFTNTFHKLSCNKDSYVIDWNSTTGTLKCVIGGYYFEISNHTNAKDWFLNGTNTEPFHLCITTSPVVLTNAEADGERTTAVLSSFAETTDYLDAFSDPVYFFTGLVLKTEEELNASRNVTASLAPFNLIDGQLVVKPSVLPITNLLDTAAGKYAIRMVEDSFVEGGTTYSNTTTANGAYAVALGKRTQADGVASTALCDNTTATGDAALAGGYYSTAAGKYTFVAGDHTVASANGAVALGSNTIASASNQVVIGKYNKSDENKAFIIANGDSSRDDDANKFTVSYEGNVKALGNLEVKGNIKATGGTTNDLELGATVAGSSGSIKVYGTTDSADPVFSVENNGNTTITGVTEITDDTDYSETTTPGGETTVAAALQVAGGVGISKNVKIGGTTDLVGATTVHGNLLVEKTVGVETEPATTLKGTLTTHGATIVKNTLTVDGNYNTTLGGGLAVSGNTVIEATTDYTNTEGTISAAVNVAGGAYIAKQLVVGSDTNLGNKFLVKTNPASSDTTAKIDGSLKVTGSAILDSSLVVANKATLNGALAINGNVVKNEGKENEEIIYAIASTGTGNNDLVLGKPDAGSCGSIKVFGSANSPTPIFQVATSGDTSIGGVTESDSTDTGALKVSGGVGITKNVHIGGTLNAGTTAISGNITAAKTGTSEFKLGSTTSGQSGRLYVYGTTGSSVFSVEETGNTSIKGSTTISGRTTIENDTAASLDNGALIVTGGINIGRGIYAKGDLTVAGDTISTLTLGNNFDTSNSGSSGELKIYGTGTTLVFQADQSGNLTAAGKLTVGNDNTKVTIDGGKLSGITELEVTGKIQAQYFNATTGTTTSSDARLKCNIEDYKFDKSILDLPIKRFEYIKDDSHTKYVGCIAQDLQELCPELVTETPDGMLAIQESKLVYMLLQEVKELKEKVELLERR